MSTGRDPYKVLGVDHAADPEIVMTAYRTLARLHHPDVSRAGDAERHMAEINAAWHILRDPDRRAAYDREHGITDGLPEGRPVDPPATRPSDTAPAGGSRPATGGQPQSARTSAPADAPRGVPGPVRWRRGPNGEGAAGPPPGRPRGSVLPFGRHVGWSLGEVASVDPGYLQWLVARPEGAPYQAEINVILAPFLQAADGRGNLNGLAVERPKRRRRFRR